MGKRWTMRIGEAAERIGLAVHVLRHWDDMGVVVPDRSGSGHRLYTEDHLHRMRVLRACQEVGLSLADIRLILHRDEAGRSDVIRQHLAHVRKQRERLESAERYLDHVIDCRHDLLTRCTECSAYATGTDPV